MSRKHFKLFAEAISQITDLQERKSVAYLVASVCKQSNSNFNYQTFYAACGLGD